MQLKMDMTKWIRFVIGYVFIISGVAKLLFPVFKASFSSMGIPFASSMLLLVALVEILCGSFIVSNMYVKQATIPLLFIMLAAMYLTKLPVLFEKDILSFAFDARLDIVMIILLLLINYGKGNH